MVIRRWFSEEARDDRRTRRIAAREDALIRATGGKGLLVSLNSPPAQTTQQVQAESGFTAVDFDFD